MDEDCLYVNVSAPQSSAPAGGHPVLVWIHGGGYHFGSGASDVGDGAAFATLDTVVVSFNYRLGALGFLNLPDEMGAKYNSAANAGLLDQIAALQWVQRNVEAFGGNPRRVTVAGVSSGAKSVSNLMGSSVAGKLFVQAISQSGGEYVTRPEAARRLTAKLLEVLDIRPSKERLLLHIPAEVLLGAQQQIADGVKATYLWRPMIDGQVLVEAPIRSIARGSSATVRLMAGTTTNEAGGHDAADPTAAEQVPRILDSIFGSSADEVLGVYVNNRATSDAKEAKRAVMADERYGIPTLRLLEAQSSHAPCWRWLFEGVVRRPSEGYKAWHAADVPLIWNVDQEGRTQAERSLGRAIRTAWANFIHGGSPRDRELPEWPQYRNSTRETMVLGARPRVERDPGREERLLWAGVEWSPGCWWELT